MSHCPLYLRDGDTESELNVLIRTSKKVIKCVFMHNIVNKIYMSRSSVCIVRTLCKVITHIASYNGDIEVGPDSRQVPKLLNKKVNLLILSRAGVNSI